jgi:hypothetical protein
MSPISSVRTVSSNRLEPVVSRAAIYVRSLAIVAALVVAPVALHADCLPEVQPGWYLPFYMQTHGVNQVVSYSKGNLYSYSGRYPTYRWANFLSVNNRQLFNDRVVFFQPFSIDYPDSIDLYIHADPPPAYPNSSRKIDLQVTLNTWGNWSIFFQGYCDSNTNVLRGSANGTEFTISFGAPFRQ